MKITLLFILSLTVTAQQTTVNGRRAYSGAVNAQTGTYQALVSDFNAPCGTIPVASGTFTITLVASGSQPPAGQCVNVINYGSGVVTIARSGQNINGGTASLTLTAGSATAPTGATVYSDGANYEAQTFGAGAATSCSSASSPQIGTCLVEEHTVSNGATIDFTTCISATYTNYIFTLENVLPQTSTANLIFRVGTGVGPTYDSGSNYEWAAWASNEAAASAATGAAAGTSATILASLANTSTAGVSGSGQLFNPASGTQFPIFNWQVSGLQSTPHFSQTTGGVRYITTTPVTAIRFLMDSGNISGTIRCYGLAK